MKFLNFIYFNYIIINKAYIKFLIKYLLIFFIIILILINLNIIKRKKRLIYFTKNNINYLFNDREDMFRKGRKYINKCLSGLLLNKNKFNLAKKPIISIIIPVFNCQKSIRASIRSIQNQNISEIEIILVNDYSKDNSLEVIKKLQKFDSRIKIINNIRTMGTLYTRSIGALAAKGEYILTLDDDDMFFGDDIFDLVYKIGKNHKLDIIGFKSLLIRNYSYTFNEMKDNPFSNHTNNLTLYQPDLRRHPILKYGYYNDINIWGKGIKANIYKKSVNILGKKRYSNYICWAEDTIIVFIIFSIANSYKFIDKYGVIHLFSNHTASFTQPETNIIFGEIFFLNILFEFSPNDYYKNVVIYYALKIKRKHQLNEFTDKKILLYLKVILEKIIKSKYISKRGKDILKEKFQILYKNIF